MSKSGGSPIHFYNKETDLSYGKYLAGPNDNTESMDHMWRVAQKPCPCLQEWEIPWEF